MTKERNLLYGVLVKDDDDWELCETYKKELEAVKKERDKLHDYIQGRWMEGDAVKNLIKLEVENAELKIANKAFADGAVKTWKPTAQERQVVINELRATLTASEKKVAELEKQLCIFKGNICEGDKR